MLNLTLAPTLGTERFLYPSASLVATYPGEQIQNANAENSPLDGIFAVNGTLTRQTATRFRGGAAIRLEKTVAAPTQAYAYSHLEPPRGLFVPNVRRVVGPYDHVAVQVGVADSFVTVQNIDRWPTSGTAAFEHALRNSSGARPIEEFAWFGKSSSQLTPVFRNIRNENNAVVIEVGDYLVGTSYLNRFLVQVAVMNTLNATQARLEVHPQYSDGGGGWLFASTGVVGSAWTLPLNEWVIMELVYDFRATNIADPTNLPATRLEVRLVSHENNAINSLIHFDEFRLSHMLQLPRRDDDPADTVVDVGEVFERTAGGVLRSARARPVTRRTLLNWSRRNPISSTVKNQLINWHRDLCYAPGAASRSFDFQGIGRDGFPLEQEEVVWADSAPVLSEAGVVNEWALSIPLEHVASDTAGIQRAGLK